MSIKVRLEDGRMEKFHRSHIIESLETIGLDHAAAKKIANGVEQHKGMSEHEIKVKIFQELDRMNPDMANRYLETKKVHVRSDTSQVRGNVLVPEFLMDYLDLKNGDRVDIIHGHKNSILRAYELKDITNHQDHDMIFMSQPDIMNIDAKEKHQVAICKHHE